MNLAVISSELTDVLKIINAPNLASAQAAIKAHFLNVGDDVALLETALAIGGVFFAPLAQAGDDIKAIVALYNIFKTIRGLVPVPEHDFTAFGQKFTSTLF